MSDPAPSAAPSSSASASPGGFQPVQGQEPELQSGERLLVEAYAAAWIVVFALVFVWVRKHRALEERMTRLEKALAAKTKDEES